DFVPTNILLIDAAVLGLKPGGSKIIKPEKLDMFPAFSTHHLPLRMFCGYLSETTKAKIILLLIEPEDVGFGEGLTPKIDATATKIVNILIKVLP
ncbi:MAG: hydrogenase maturation protease, partial [Candidatus Bathyarchaeia archaeon]